MSHLWSMFFVGFNGTAKSSHPEFSGNDTTSRPPYGEDASGWILGVINTMLGTCLAVKIAWVLASMTHHFLSF